MTVLLLTWELPWVFVTFESEICLVLLYMYLQILTEKKLLNTVKLRMEYRGNAKETDKANYVFKAIGELLVWWVKAGKARCIHYLLIHNKLYKLHSLKQHISIIHSTCGLAI